MEVGIGVGVGASSGVPIEHPIRGRTKKMSIVFRKEDVKEVSVLLIFIV
jgi:hypothetical protein